VRLSLQTYVMFLEEPIRLLSVSVFEDDHAGLRRILSGANWQVVGASTTKDAKALLLANQMPLVICAASVCDSEWKSWVVETCQLPEAPKLIISSRLACESLWTEALDLGCYDVLSWPYVASEVLRVVSLAWHRWKWDCVPPRGALKAASFGLPTACQL
jgi:DNA-binding response OmpR family regulator